MIKRILPLLLCALFPLMLAAQKATDIVARQVGNTIEITYNLDKDAITTLYLSRDGGETYKESPKSLTGDIGVTGAGKGKKIVWNILADGDDWDIAQARFKIETESVAQLTFTVGKCKFVMVQVEGGTFQMGCTSEQGDDCSDLERPVRTVTVGDFHIAQTEVTQALWQAVMGTNIRQQRQKADVTWDIYGEGDNYPMYYVSWLECQEFIRRLNSVYASQLGGLHFALPTEAQWEYAARGGSQPSPYQKKYSGSDLIGSVAWYENNSNHTTHPVATKIANTLDIYDMSGNVREWCEDNYVVRGGSWFDKAANCRVSYRTAYTQNARFSSLGFRLVLTK